MGMVFRSHAWGSHCAPSLAVLISRPFSGESWGPLQLFGSRVHTNSTGPLRFAASPFTVRKNSGSQQRQPLCHLLRLNGTHRSLQKCNVHSNTNHKVSKESSRLMCVFFTLTSDSVPPRVSARSSVLQVFGFMIFSPTCGEVTSLR